MPAESLAAEWHRRADALGFDAVARARLFGRTRPVPPSRDVLAQAARVMLGAGGLTERAAVFDRRDALRAWCAQLPGGAPVGYVERLADTLLGHPEVVPVDPVTTGCLRPGAVRSFRRHTTSGIQRHMSTQELRALPAVVDLLTAAAVLDIGRTVAYDLVRTGRWPTPVLRLGGRIKVPTAPLLELLGVSTGPPGTVPASAVRK